MSKPAKNIVEIEVERDQTGVTFSVRCGSANLVLTMPIESASVFSATSTRAVAEDVTEQTFRFIVTGSLTGKIEEL